MAEILGIGATHYPPGLVPEELKPWPLVRALAGLVDPATGRPVEHSLASVTVVADTCLEADGWDTPLLVLGPQRGFAVAERLAIAALFLERDGDEHSARATTAWQTKFGSDRSE